jgi:hypothetical protein
LDPIRPVPPITTIFMLLPSVAMWNGGKITQLGRCGHYAYSGAALAIWQANLALGAGWTRLAVAFPVSTEAVGAGDASLGERFSSSGPDVPHPVSNRSPVRRLIGLRR